MCRGEMSDRLDGVFMVKPLQKDDDRRNAPHADAVRLGNDIIDRCRLFIVFVCYFFAI